MYYEIYNQEHIDNIKSIKPEYGVINIFMKGDVVISGLERFQGEILCLSRGPKSISLPDLKGLRSIQLEDSGIISINVPRLERCTFFFAVDNKFLKRVNLGDAEVERSISMRNSIFSGGPKPTHNFKIIRDGGHSRMERI